MTLSRSFRAISWVEGSTLLGLMLIAVPLKRLAGIPEVVSIMGPIHGIFFLLYLWSVFDTAARAPTAKGFLWKAVEVSLIPGGTFWYLRTLRSASVTKSIVGSDD